VPSVRDLTDPYRSTFVTVPSAGEGVCDVCHGPTTRRSDGTFWPTCWSCGETTKRVDHPVRLIVPVSLTHTAESQWYAVLKEYKAEWQSSDVRARYRQRIAAMLARFLISEGHDGCIGAAAGDEWDAIAVVPSTRRSGARHPLEEAIQVAPPRLREQLETLLEPGPGTIGRNSPAEDGYRALPAANGRRVLLVDDTLAGGAHLQSAATALVAGGADVIAAVVLGRVVDTSDDRYPEKREFWERQHRTRFDFSRCCLEE